MFLVSFFGESKEEREVVGPKIIKRVAVFPELKEKGIRIFCFTNNTRNYENYYF
jgi:hypothetical protein